jgi:hypothetical protein
MTPQVTKFANDVWRLFIAKVPARLFAAPLHVLTTSFWQVFLLGHS